MSITYLSQWHLLISLAHHIFMVFLQIKPLRLILWAIGEIKESHCDRSMMMLVSRAFTQIEKIVSLLQNEQEERNSINPIAKLVHISKVTDTFIM